MLFLLIIFILYFFDMFYIHFFWYMSNIYRLYTLLLYNISKYIYIYKLNNIHC